MNTWTVKFINDEEMQVTGTRKSIEREIEREVEERFPEWRPEIFRWQGSLSLFAVHPEQGRQVVARIVPLDRKPRE